MPRPEPHYRLPVVDLQTQKRLRIEFLSVSVSSVTLDQPALAEAHLTTHDVEHKHSRAVVAVKRATRRLDNLAVARSPHFRRAGTALRLLRKLLDVLKNSLHETPRRLRVVERDVIGNGLEVMESWLRPNQLSHRAMRFLASA